jgi:hypothetical protein
MNLHLAVPAFLLGLLVSAASAACGDDSSAGSQLTLEEYFERLEAAYTRAYEAEAALEEQLDQGGRDDLEAVRDTVPAFGDIHDSLIADLTGLDPPDAARNGHGDILDAHGAIRTELERLEEDSKDAQSVDELMSLGDTAEFAAADEAFTAACSALQEIADDNAIDVDLDCE